MMLRSQTGEVLLSSRQIQKNTGNFKFARIRRKADKCGHLMKRTSYFCDVLRYFLKQDYIENTLQNGEDTWRFFYNYHSLGYDMEEILPICGKLSQQT